MANKKENAVKVPLAKAGTQIAHAYRKAIGDFLGRADIEPDAAIVVIQVSTRTSRN